ncbi:MAG: CusA/CzcA family heavy metal efflux RND transporter [Saprospiraceae bacterium]|nr:CusA/CzcA family heavy metal efflux RND transporter [Saprospiraceae bacterium]
MINRIIHFSIHNKFVIGIGTLALIAAGVWSFTKLPIDAVPDITNNQVQIITLSPTLATAEVEQYISAPIEIAAKTIPDLVELRSISRFGLSVVTVVFDEDKDIWLARQQITEKLKEVEEDLPAGVGTPELAPVSTGLGEVYQYVVEPKPGYESKYNAMDLRTIQDWIVKRQLAGIPGVAEINSMGGLLKQYEVAVDPQRLNAAGLTISDVFSALEKSNQNTGGAYIERNSQFYFIRGEGVTRSIDDLQRIVVTPAGGAGAGSPRTIGDIAEVGFGSATRYGAVTEDGKGEVVTGIVMMLKGYNSSAVVASVKERLVQVQKSLPEGVQVRAFLDRAALVKRTIDTVQRNLIEGALIVIFILVLLVGNFRAGLVIASVIPLAMLFALWMMHLFGVSANLMSLGAIDFGLIVDGAVIIVEATLYYFHTHFKPPAGSKFVQLTQEQMDESVYKSASGIMRSSVFGVIIILIVYLPLLALVGIEGKMFRPMAQTVSFALVGALLLSLTYVPMVSALFLSKKIDNRVTFADRIIAACQRVYNPVLEGALRIPKTVLAVVLGLFVVAIFFFSRLGGEFIPQLDEGDLALESSFPQGTSLSQVIEGYKLIEGTLIRNFPDEVEGIVTKIGAAEIPTDPMPMSAGDVTILLKDREEWKVTDNKAELVEMMEEKLRGIPGANIEFTQPIELRFNELMTGSKGDVAVKIYGENLDTLAALAASADRLIKTVSGVSSKVEQTLGLPQINVQYNYAKLAQYGLHVKDVNTVLSTAFAGAVAGVIYEDGKRFDLAVRLAKSNREDIEDVRNLLISTDNAAQNIPLGEVAIIEYRTSPAQISRDDANRRIVIGVNLLGGRDVESAVRDMQEKLSALKLPPGYFITYGGQFENLKAAKARLGVAVPLALVLIIVLLYFAFNSMKESLLIFTAVPLSAIGGVFALMLRGMPFSISAGVGFIALFGVAVLNGIVLIAYFNQLEKSGVTDVLERIRKGTSVRLRPVLMTAAVASLGFLPMAMSTGAGAEVQRPLATVVIGGLLTATLLTLIVLPVLYSLFFKNTIGGKGHSKTPVTAVLLVLAFFVFGNTATAQTALTEQQAIEILEKNHPALQAAGLRVTQQQTLSGAVKIWEPGQIFNNIAADPDLGMFGTTSLGVSQTFPSGKATRANRALNAQNIRQSQAGLQLTRRELILQVRENFQHIGYLQSRITLLARLDSVYQNFNAVADARYRTGDASQAEKLAVQDRAAQIRLQIETARREIISDQFALGQLLGLGQSVLAITEPLKVTGFSLDDSVRVMNSAYALYAQSAIGLAEAQKKVQQAALAPTFSAGLFGQYLGNGDIYPGWQLGLNVPLFKKAQQKQVQAAGIGVQVAQSEYQNALLAQQTRLTASIFEFQKFESLTAYYDQQGRTVASELLRSGALNYQQGEIGYFEYVLNLDQALQIESQYLENLLQRNLTVIEIQYLTNQN